MRKGSWDPRAEYTQRLENRKTHAERFDRLDSRLANWRLAVFGAALALVVLILRSDVVSWIWLAVPALVFVVLAVMHERTLRKKERREAGTRYYERCLSRIENRWAGEGVQGEDLLPDGHVYAADLDLFGEASLFELLCTARTRAGEEALASWLCGPASVDEIERRQEAVDELRHRIDLREELAILGGEVRATVKPRELVRWATGAPVEFSTAERHLAKGLSGAAIISTLGWAFFGFGVLPLVAVVLVEMGFMRYVKTRVERINSAIDEPAKDLDVLSTVLKRLEEEPFKSAKLVELQQIIVSNGEPASNTIARLHALLERLDQQRNMVFAPIAFLLLWPVHIAFALERWRANNGEHVAQWLASLGELEALCSIAAYAYEHPEDPFPELARDLIYEGRELGHPLISDEDCVRNDVTLGAAPQVLVVSGSNMSGKSTLLRTVGINAVLAMMGAPVHARSLRLCPVALGATLRIQDSIQRGASRFYAEIKRLRELMELTKGSLPLLFLLDEVLHGTNSHDRGIGAQAVIKGFIDEGSVGLVTTHDLSLTNIVEALGDKAENVHFEDHLEGDKLVFDYKMRPGVVQKSNALALMRAVGLEV